MTLVIAVISLILIAAAALVLVALGISVILLAKLGNYRE